MIVTNQNKILIKGLDLLYLIRASVLQMTLTKILYYGRFPWIGLPCPIQGCQFLPIVRKYWQNWSELWSQHMTEIQSCIISDILYPWKPWRDVFWQYSLDVSPSLEDNFLLLPHTRNTALFLLDMLVGGTWYLWLVVTEPIWGLMRCHCMRLVALLRHCVQSL